MKVAVSIPDSIFAEAEILAKRWKVSRSKIYARALGQFVANNAPNSITESMNAAVDATAADDDSPDVFLREAGRRIFEKTEW